MLPHPQPHTAMRGHSEKAAICKLGREPSPDPDCAGSWSWIFLPLEPWEINSVVEAAQPVVFVMAAQAKTRALTTKPSVTDWPRSDTYASSIGQIPSLLEFGTHTGKVQSALVTCKFGNPGVIIFRLPLICREMKMKLGMWTKARTRKRKSILPEFLTAST